MIEWWAYNAEHRQAGWEERRVQEVTLAISKLNAAFNGEPLELLNKNMPTELRGTIMVDTYREVLCFLYTIETRAVQPVAICRQSPYLHKPAIVIVTSFSLWRHSHYDFLRLRRSPTVTDVRYGDLTAFNIKLEMWANAQRDGRPAEHRWRPLFNVAKCGWRPLLDAVQ